MIRYPVPLADIEAKVDAAVPNWKSRAARRTTALRRKGRYEEATSIWSEVKPVFMKLQYNKCAYCEQKLEGGSYGSIAHDLEHYRPKSNVRAWTNPHTPCTFPLGDASPGYHLLAYHLGNYAAACKICNTLLKSDYFPIAGTRHTDKDHPTDCDPENPYLVYPLGSTGDNPEDLLAFRFTPDNHLVCPRHTEATNLDHARRARILIDFFDLNRDGLRYSRAVWLTFVWETYLNAQSGNLLSARRLTNIQKPSAPHTACSRQFLTLCQQTRQADMETHYIPILDKIIEENSD